MFLSFGFSDADSGSPGAEANGHSEAQEATVMKAMTQEHARKDAQMAVLEAVERGELSPEEALDRLDEIESG